MTKSYDDSNFPSVENDSYPNGSNTVVEDTDETLPINYLDDIGKDFFGFCSSEE
jgi:hypothetical protein